MTDTAYLELLASYEAALDAADRSLIIVRELTDGLLDGQLPPADAVRAHALQVDRDTAQLTELRTKVQQFKSWFRTH